MLESNPPKSTMLVGGLGVLAPFGELPTYPRTKQANNNIRRATQQTTNTTISYQHSKHIQQNNACLPIRPPTYISNAPNVLLPCWGRGSLARSGSLPGFFPVRNLRELSFPWALIYNRFCLSRQLATAAQTAHKQGARYSRVE